MRKWPFGILLFSLLSGMASTSALASSVATSSPFTFGYFVQVVFSLVLVIALVLGAVWGMKRLSLGVPGMKSPVKLVGGTMLGGKERLVVVEVDNEWLVLGVTAQSISVLKQMQKPEGADNPPPPVISPKFTQWLQQAIEKTQKKNAPK